MLLGKEAVRHCLEAILQENENLDFNMVTMTTALNCFTMPFSHQSEM